MYGILTQNCLGRVRDAVKEYRLKTHLDLHCQYDSLNDALSNSQAEPDQIGSKNGKPIGPGAVAAGWALKSVYRNGR